MDWHNTVFEVIDFRSFSNLWYWIALAVLWSSVSHWILGVPYDLVLRARRRTPPEAMDDLQTLVQVNVNRLLYISEVSGSWITLFGSGFLTVLTIMAFTYQIEFAQAVLLMAAPMVIVGWMTLRTARKIRATALEGDGLVRKLIRHRFLVQLVGIFAIFITAMFGMYKNLYTGPFSGF